MRVLVTGGAGFIGSHLVDMFLARGDETTIFDTTASNYHPEARTILGNIEDRHAVEQAVAGHDMVIHAAGSLGTHETVLTPAATITTNVMGTLMVIEAVKNQGSRLINISKPNVWLNPYSITKDCVEKLCFMYAREFNTQIAIVKLFNVYGPRQKFTGIQKAIPHWIVSTLRSEPVQIYGTGEATMDLVHVSDVNAGIAGIVDNFDRCAIRADNSIAADVWGNFPSYNDQILELGSGKDISVNQSVAALAKAFNRVLEVQKLPMRRGEIDNTRLCANIDLITASTGYQPQKDLQVGLQETISFYEKNTARIASGKL